MHVFPDFPLFNNTRKKKGHNLQARLKLAAVRNVKMDSLARPSGALSGNAPDLTVLPAGRTGTVMRLT